MTFLGLPYPVRTHPRGFFRTQEGLEQIKSDLLVLLLTNPGERVMLPEFGTPLRNLLFDQNDFSVSQRAREMITTSIATWEPRVAIQELDITLGSNITVNDLTALDRGEKENILLIRIRFSDFDNVQEVQELKLEIPLSGV